jgi:hypothetical protein
MMRAGREAWARLIGYLPSTWASTAIVAVAATLFNWPGWAQIRAGLDPSWQAGLAVAFTHHLRWGPQLDFTYGPYGFAGFIEPLYRSTALIAILYVFAVTWLLAVLLVAGARRYWGLGAAGVLAWAAIALSSVVLRAADFASVAGLGLALVALQAERLAVRRTMTTALAALAGFALLVKLNTGVVLVGLLALALVGVDKHGGQGLRAAGQAIAALAAVFVISWAAAGQSFTNLASFAHASLSLSLGYSAAMGGRLSEVSIAWYALAISVVAALVYASALRGRSRRYQVVVSLMLIGWGWAVLKDSFVGGNHFPGFFRIVLVAVALVCLCRPPRWALGSGLTVVFCIALAAAPEPVVNPIGSLHALGTELADLVQPARFAQLTRASRKRLDRGESLGRPTLALLGRRSLAIEPWEDMVAWADPNASWDPEPVVQAYSAYTTYLDNMDASFVASARAPQVILYWPLRFGFDSRDPFMDPPSTSEAIYCHYVQVAVERPWQVLQRVPDRCGPPVTIGKVRARFGQLVRVPGAGGRMVVARFSLAQPFFSKVEGLLLKPPAVHLTVWGAGTSPVTYSFVAGTAGDEHVLSVPVTLGYSSRFTPPTVRQLKFTGGGWSLGQGTVVVTFQALDVAPH